jgi:hypothetical protein
MVEKFQLLQTAHEVLSDPLKRATYDRTRGATGRATAYFTSTSTKPTTPKNRYARPTPGTNGFSKATPNTSPNKPTKPAFGHFTTREPPSSAKRPTPNNTTKPPATANPGMNTKTRPTARQTAERERTERYFDRFREKAAGATFQQYTPTSPQKPTPNTRAQQRKEGARTAAGIKTPDRKRAGFGSTFDEETSEEDTFFSFSSNGGTFNGTEKGAGWSERRGAYSHVYTGVKEDVRSPLKETPTANTTPFSSDGFFAKPNLFSNGSTTQGQTSTSEDKMSGSTKQNGFGFGQAKDIPKENGHGIFGNAQKEASQPIFGGGFAKETDKKFEGPPIFSFTTNGPAQRKTSQPLRSTSASTEGKPSSHSSPSNPNEIPKTPPPVEERRFAFAFSRLNVDPSPVKTSPTKKKDAVNIEDWAKKFENMNPFMTPGTKKLAEDNKFWSSVPLASTPSPAKTRPVRGRGKKGGLGDMADLKRDLPKTEPTSIFATAKARPVAPIFQFEASQKPDERNINSNPSAMPAPAPVQPSTPAVNPQQPTPAATPAFQQTPFNFNPTPNSPPAPAPFAFGPTPKPSIPVPELNPPTPPKRLIPRPSKPQEFSFSVPPLAEMQSLSAEVQGYHVAYVTERSRFETAWKTYESQVQLTDEQKVRSYLEINSLVIKQRAEMEALHTLCLERWGAVAKFSGFAG